MPRVAGKLLDALGVSPAERSWIHGQMGSIGDVVAGVRLFPAVSK